MKNKLLIIVGACVVLIGIFGWYVFNSLAQFAPPAPTPQATVATMSGVALAHAPGSTDWKPVTLNETLHEGDSLKTGDNSSLELNFFDNSRAHLAPNTEIELKKLYIDTAHPAKQQVDITMVVGRTWNRIISLLDSEASYQVETNSTVATVRGTIVDAAQLPDGQEEIRSMEHTVKVTLKADPTKHIDVTELHQVIIPPAPAKPTTPTEQPAIPALTLQPLDQSFKEGTWVRDNGAQDTQFDAMVKVKKESRVKEAVGLTPDSPFYQVKLMAEQVKLAMTNDASAKEAIKCAIEERRVLEATLRKETRKESNGADTQKSSDNKISTPSTKDTTKEATISKEESPSLTTTKETKETEVKSDEKKTETTTELVKPTIATPPPALPIPPARPLEKIEKPKPVSLILTAPRLNLPAGTSMQILAQAKMSDGQLSPAQNCRWSLDGDAIGDISQSGLLTTNKDGGVADVVVSCEKDGVTLKDSLNIHALTFSPGL